MSPPDQFCLSLDTYGSHLGWMTAENGLPYAAQTLWHACPVLRPERASLVRIPLGPCPWLRQLRGRQAGPVRRFHRYYGKARRLTSVHHRLRLLAFPMRTGVARHRRPDVRPPRFRRDPFVRDGVFDHGRASAPRITAPHMLPSTSLTVSASAIFCISWLNSPPHTIVVYASRPSSPTVSRNTYYQAGATPYLGRSRTGWIEPASWRTGEPQEDLRSAMKAVTLPEGIPLRGSPRGPPWCSGAPGSWRDPAGASPAQVRGSARLVVSVASPWRRRPGEAYTTIVWGGLLSRERHKPAEAETVGEVEGNMCGAAMRGAVALPWSKTPSRTNGSRRNLGDLTSDQWRTTAAGPRREGEEP